MVQIACPHCLTANRVPAARLGEDPECGKCHAEPLPGALAPYFRRAAAQFKGRVRLAKVNTDEALALAASSSGSCNG